MRVTPDGTAEFVKVINAVCGWLAEELSDWGADDDVTLTAALDDFARRWVNEEADLIDEPADALPG
jgi:hypothetical protein